MVADMEMDMVADMKVDKVADMKVDMVANMKVDMVADMRVDKVDDKEVDLVVGNVLNRVAHMVPDMGVWAGGLEVRGPTENEKLSDLPRP